MKYFYPLLIACLALACQPQAPTSESAPLTTLILLRHAEQDTTQGEDPPLSQQGQRRAAHLRTLLGATKLAALYATPYRRTTATAQPLAEALEQEVRTYDPDQDLRLTAQQLLQAHPGETILVVGHSSTIPGLVNALLGENRYASLDKTAFGDLFVVTCGDSSQVTVLHQQMPL